MDKPEYDTITESHLAKKYSDILYDVMMRCNMTGYALESEPHINNLMPFTAAIHSLYKNTFMLFYSVKIGSDAQKVNLAQILYDKILKIKTDMRVMRRDTKNVQKDAFEELVEECNMVHMLINDGLQSLNMLVRMGTTEPRGKDSVIYWNTKTAFKKGGLQDKSHKPELKFFKNNKTKTKVKSTQSNFFIK